MKVYCGTDIIEIDRIKKAIESTEDAFLDKVYTKNEIEHCESKRAAKYQHYAARFAAKEAVFKAVSDLVEDKYSIGWQNMELVNKKSGRPIVKFKNLKKELEYLYEMDIDISISHNKNTAIAMVVLLKK